MFDEFKKFAMRGNVVDMAVGIVIGTAFGKIVSSFVNDVLMPPIGWMMGGMDFSQLSLTIQEKTASAEAVTINYGVFINTLLDFLIIALAIFMVVKSMNSLNKEEEKTTKDCDKCFQEIPKKATRCAFCTSEVVAS